MIISNVHYSINTEKNISKFTMMMMTITFVEHHMLSIYQCITQSNKKYHQQVILHTDTTYSIFFLAQRSHYRSPHHCQNHCCQHCCLTLSLSADVFRLCEVSYCIHRQAHSVHTMQCCL